MRPIIVAQSCAGKSTFIRQVTGVEIPTSGKIYFDGDLVNFKTPADAKKAGIEAVYQNLALADDLDVPSNIFLGQEETYFNLGPFSFLNENKIPLSSVFDATGLSRSKYSPIMEKLEKWIAIGVTPCKKSGHTMRTKLGHCIQCNLLSNSFLLRHINVGEIYIAGTKSGHFLKIGTSKNSLKNRLSYKPEK